MDRKGLTTAEALERGKKGKNVLTQGKKKSLFSVIAEQFASPLLLLLVAASVISIMTGEIVDGIIIIVVCWPMSSSAPCRNFRRRNRSRPCGGSTRPQLW